MLRSSLLAVLAAVCLSFLVGPAQPACVNGQCGTPQPSPPMFRPVLLPLPQPLPAAVTAQPAACPAVQQACLPVAADVPPLGCPCTATNCTPAVPGLPPQPCVCTASNCTCLRATPGGGVTQAAYAGSYTAAYAAPGKYVRHELGAVARAVAFVAEHRPRLFRRTNGCR